MTTRHLIATAAALTFAAFTAAAAAQTHAEGLLTQSQVRDLTAKAATPAQHAQLRDHFSALARQYDADAKRFGGKAPLAGGNPNRRSGVDYGMHWTRLGQTAGEMAKSARELSAFHGKLATGEAATRPAASAHAEHLERGAGAPQAMSDAQLQQAIANARTPGDHGKLAEYFNGLASIYTKDADAHAAMAAGYRGNSRSNLTFAADHCDRLAKQARTAATEARALAADHQAPAQ